MYGIDETDSDKRGVGRPKKVYTEEERPKWFWVAIPHRLWSLLPNVSSERNRAISNLIELAYGDSSLMIREIHERIAYLSQGIKEFTAEATEKIDALKKEEQDIMQAKAKIEESKRNGVI